MVTDSPLFGEPRDTLGEPLRNDAVVQAMKNVAAADSPVTRALLFQLLLDTSLLAVTPSPPARPHAWTAQAGEALDLVTLADAEGTVLPLFTSTAAISRWRPQGAGYVAMASRALFEVAAANGTNKIALDPNSGTTGYLTRHEIEQLARGRLPTGPADVVAEKAEIRIGKPAVPPPAEVLQVLRSALGAEVRAEQAWYFLMQQGEHSPEMVIAISFTPGLDATSIKRAMRSVVDSAGQRARYVQDVAFMVADDGLQTSMRTGAAERFYSKT